MASDAPSPQRENTPSGVPPSIPQKRALADDDHTPAISSPLNPDGKPAQRVQIQTPEEGQAAMSREKRTKKDSLKKRESKGTAAGNTDSARATPDRKVQKDVTLVELAPLRYKLPLPKPTDFEPPRGPVFTSHHVIQDLDGKTVEFLEPSDQVSNKKNYQYTHCIADPIFPSLFYYRRTEPEPFGPHISFEDRASHVLSNSLGNHITTDKGFRTARANVAAREGRWYWECKITRGILKKRSDGDPESHGHVRLGWARREASLDAPVGFDAYSYGIRDVAGQKVHMSRPKDFFPPGEDLREGDVIGLEIQLPSERLHRKVVQGQYNPAVDLADEELHGSGPAPEASNIVRDRIPIRFKSHIYFEKIDYHTTKELDDLMNPSPMAAGASSEPPNPNHPAPALRTLPNSHIKLYKNGVLMGTPFTDLLSFLPPASKMTQQPPGRECLDDGSLGYYPAVSVFRGGAVELNFGPDFWFPPPGISAAGEGEGSAEDVDMVDAGAVPRRPPPNLAPISDRYSEQIAEDIVYDIIDEVGFLMQDGGKVVDRTGKDDKASEAPGLVPVASEDIKELVQDD
ncbi:hypothetical protein B0T18DRAFT_330044 [Schizothecium vesticola]|uniref:B30.2/SPRY domain-containing protein n=1 Tax=Schizothecium vesticola TaxID=314040 RepID=A0AA40EQS9_9PEZI|nr:hypothetical protein B0T18DRAFT_330044 [Schizothecium vesticola]